MKKTEGREVKISATDKQRLAWEAWNSPDIDDLVYGGYAGGGKTILAGQVLTATALQYPGSKQFLGRKELKRLMQTSYISLTQKVFPMYGLKQDDDWYLDGKYNVIYIRNGPRSPYSTIDLLDLDTMPSDPLFDRFGSSEYTRGWIEEASEVAFKAYDVLKSRVGRWMNVEQGIKSKLGLSLNPSQDWPYRMFYKPWDKAGRPVDPKRPLVSVSAMVDGVLVERTFCFIPASPGDNPFTAGEYMRNLATISDPVLKARLMQGDWEYADAANVLFDARGIADIFRNPPNHSNDYYLTVDVARFGGDKIVLTHWRGWDAFRIDHFTRLPIHETADKIRTALDMFGIPRDHCLIDADGVGGGVVDLVPGCIPFAGGAAPFGKVGEKEVRENYDNLRTQCVYHLAEKVRQRGLIVSEPNIEIREWIALELAQFKRRDSDKDGRLKIAKKEDMKSSLGHSPDFADTLMMRAYWDLRQREPAAFGNQEITVFIPE